MKYLCVLVLLTTAACASKPILYPNSKLKSVGQAQANNDREECMAEAEAYLESSKGNQVAKGAARGAAVGAAIGAVAGILTGNVNNAVKVGARTAAVGAAGGAAGAAVSPDQLKRNFVNQCLGEKGYRVIGWD